jgi:transcriptional regulator with XRE-family HTH domain
LEIRHLVRREREARGWSQRELANRAGVGHATVAFLERGEKEPSAKTVQQLADAFDIPVGDLFPKAGAPAATGGRRREPAQLEKESPPLETLSQIREHYSYNLSETEYLCEWFAHQVTQAQGETALTLIDAFFKTYECTTNTRGDSWQHEIERLARTIGTDDEDTLAKHSLMLQVKRQLDATAVALYEREKKIRREMGLEAAERAIDTETSTTNPLGRR